MISWPPWSWQSSCLCTTNTILLNQCCWLWWWPAFWSLPSTCLLCLFPPSSSCASSITQSHQEFSSPGSSLECKFFVNLCGDSQWLFVFALHFWFYLCSQIQLRSLCWWLRSSALDLVSVLNKFPDLSLGVALLQLWFILFSSGSSWLKNNFFFLAKVLTLYGWRLCAFLSSVICKHLGVCVLLIPASYRFCLYDIPTGILFIQGIAMNVPQFVSLWPW